MKTVLLILMYQYRQGLTCVIRTKSLVPRMKKVKEGQRVLQM